MYVFRNTHAKLGSGSWFHNSILIELSEQALRELIDMAEHEGSDEKWVTYRRATAAQAHDWVKRGGRHETPLWVDDDGSLRYGRINE